VNLATLLAGLGGTAMMYAAHYLGRDEKMTTAANEKIVWQLEQAGCALGVDGDGDVTLDHVLKAIERLGTDYRLSTATGASLRRAYTREGILRRRAEEEKASVQRQVEELLRQRVELIAKVEVLEHELAQKRRPKKGVK
jgi:hypothetical protein